MTVKYVGNFWISLEMSLINYKLKLKLKWAKYCVLSAAGNDNITNNNDNDIIFAIKDTKLHVHVVALSARGNPKLTKFHRKGFERSIYWNKYKRKSENKNTIREHINFLQSNLVGVNRLFVLVYANHGDNAKSFKNNVQKCYLPKGIIKSYNVIINGENVHDQEIDSNIKWYEEIWNLTTG